MFSSWTFVFDESIESAPGSYFIVVIIKFVLLLCIIFVIFNSVIISVSFVFGFVCSTRSCLMVFDIPRVDC